MVVSRNIKKKRLKNKKSVSVVSEKELIETGTDEEIGLRRSSFISYYTDPKSPTYDNALQSAIKAGFTPFYSRNILTAKPRWLYDIIGKSERSKVSFIGLDEDLRINPKVQAMGPFGPIFNKKTKKPIMVLNAKLLEKRQNAYMFVLEKTHPDYQKKEKEKPGLSIDKAIIGSIIIKFPDGTTQPYN